MTLEDRLIDEWKSVWRFSSTWASGSAIGILAVWNMMPGAVHAIVPGWLELVVGLGLWGAVIVARIWSQPKTVAKIKAKADA